MAGGPPDLVDCERLAADRETLERIYDIGHLPRLQDLLADRQGRLKAEFGFSRAPSGRSGALIRVEATLRLVCQRCLEGFDYPVAARSEVEFCADAQADAAHSPGELYRSEQGLVSLRDLAEEELLLALPLVPACSAPQECGRSPRLGVAPAVQVVAPETLRPFAGLQDLLRKHDRT